MPQLTVSKPDDTVYIPIPVTDASTAYKASLHIILKHFSDFHHTILKVVSDKYDIPFEEMIMTVMEDPACQYAMENPVVNSLTYFSQNDADKTTAATTATTTTAAKKIATAVPLKKRKAPVVKTA